MHRINKQYDLPKDDVNETINVLTGILADLIQCSYENKLSMVTVVMYHDGNRNEEKIPDKNLKYVKSALPCSGFGQFINWIRQSLTSINQADGGYGMPIKSEALLEFIDEFKIGYEYLRSESLADQTYEELITTINLYMKSYDIPFEFVIFKYNEYPAPASYIIRPTSFTTMVITD